MKRNLAKNQTLKEKDGHIRLISIQWNENKDKILPSRVYLNSPYVISSIKELKEWNEKVNIFLKKKFGENPKNINTYGEPVTDTLSMGKKFKPLYEL